MSATVVVMEEAEQPAALQPPAAFLAAVPPERGPALLKALRCLQHKALAFLHKRRLPKLVNQEDVDPISLEPVTAIGSRRMFIAADADGAAHGYDAFAWVPWLARDKRHPCTRKRLSAAEIHACFATAERAAHRCVPAPPPEVRKALDSMKRLVRLVHLEELAPRVGPRRARRFASAPRRRWLLVLKLSPLVTLATVSVDPDTAPAGLSITLRDAREGAALVADEVGVCVGGVNRNNGCVALGSDPRAARLAKLLLLDLRDGRTVESELLGEGGSDDEDADEVYSQQE